MPVEQGWDNSSSGSSSYKSPTYPPPPVSQDSGQEEKNFYSEAERQRRLLLKQQQEMFNKLKTEYSPYGYDDDTIWNMAKKMVGDIPKTQTPVSNIDMPERLRNEFTLPPVSPSKSPTIDSVAPQIFNPNTTPSGTRNEQSTVKPPSASPVATPGATTTTTTPQVTGTSNDAYDIYNKANQHGDFNQKPFKIPGYDDTEIANPEAKRGETGYVWPMGTSPNPWNIGGWATAEDGSRIAPVPAISGYYWSEPSQKYYPIDLDAIRRGPVGGSGGRGPTGARGTYTVDRPYDQWRGMGNPGTGGSSEANVSSSKRKNLEKLNAALNFMTDPEQKVSTMQYLYSQAPKIYAAYKNVNNVPPMPVNPDDTTIRYESSSKRAADALKAQKDMEKAFGSKITATKSGRVLEQALTAMIDYGAQPGDAMTSANQEELDKRLDALSKQVKGKPEEVIINMLRPGMQKTRSTKANAGQGGWY